MDIILADGGVVEQGVIYTDYSLDFDTTDTMDYKLTATRAIYDKLSTATYLYIPGTEYGGIIDSITHNTSDDSIIASGRSFRGLLNSKIIAPDSEQDYKVVSGNLAEILDSILAENNLDYLYMIDPALTWITLNNYQIARYCSVLYLLNALESKTGLSLYLAWSAKYHKVVITYRQPIDWTSKSLYVQADITTTKTSHKVNHLICLGSGELKDRMRVDLYADTQGRISTIQSIVGADEYTQVYDYSNAKDVDDLTASGTEKLKELIADTPLEVEVKDGAYAVGDIVGGYDDIMQIKTKATITNVVVNVENGVISYTFTTAYNCNIISKNKEGKNGRHKDYNRGYGRQKCKC